MENGLEMSIEIGDEVDTMQYKPDFLSLKGTIGRPDLNAGIDGSKCPKLVELNNTSNSSR